ncbi:MAG: hypothetical protein ACXQS1_05800 [Methermicoccaceae archaeon]
MTSKIAAKSKIAADCSGLLEAMILSRDCHDLAVSLRESTRVAYEVAMRLREVALFGDCRDKKAIESAEQFNKEHVERALRSAQKLAEKCRTLELVLKEVLPDDA